MKKTALRAARTVIATAAVASAPLFAGAQTAHAGWKDVPAWGVPPVVIASGRTFGVSAPSVQGVPMSQSGGGAQGYRYSAMPGYSYTYVPRYSYPAMRSYPAGTVVWVPAMMPATAAYRTGAAAPAPVYQASATPGGQIAGRPQPTLCMVAARMKTATTPSRIAVIAHSASDCAAIGGSAAPQTPSTR